MKPRQPLPNLWLMTDERQGDGLWQALGRLPRGAGVVFRHYATPVEQRTFLLRRVAQLCRRRGLVLVLAGSDRPPLRIGIRGRHGRGPVQIGKGLIRTAPAHDLREIRAAERSGADLVFLSPAFATRSHRDARALGPLRFRLLARQAQVPVIALGGMNEKRAQRLAGAIYGWAGIDAWSA